MADAKQIKVTLVRSLAKKLKDHQACVRGLGLRRMHQSVVVAATPENLGMVRKAAYLLKVEEV
ncbi:LSU ribosomal protein L30P [Fontimonas thermophila]|uniref:Large ribosomal subunit protein uL30 n=1 Tax=Fontimonas thermophila TaxID=1076937 RepID=A0A1I2K128_9GAMM|nr:50S ribosomal protein L30 [Fontimonas thermophila]SFF60079.1 LSU ribosomal protein L30P [Fontimonas thermophila]